MAEFKLLLIKIKWNAITVFIDWSTLFVDNLRLNEIIYSRNEMEKIEIEENNFIYRRSIHCFQNGSSQWQYDQGLEQ